MVILIIEPRFAYIIVPGGILLVLLTYIFRKQLKKLHKQMREKDGFVRIFLQEHLGSLMIVKAFGKEADSLTEAESHMSEHKKARMRKNHFSNVCNIGFGAVMNGAYVLGAVYGAFGIYNGTMTYGSWRCFSLSARYRIRLPISQAICRSISLCLRVRRG